MLLLSLFTAFLWFGYPVRLIVGVFRHVHERDSGLKGQRMYTSSQHPRYSVQKTAKFGVESNQVLCTIARRERTSGKQRMRHHNEQK
jgi:hypothetical protein